MSLTLSPAASRAGVVFLERLPGKTKRRGRAYYDDGAVLELACAEPDSHYTAEVQGGELYEVDLFFEDSSWSSECSCPVGLECKHAVAAMWALLAQAGQRDGSTAAAQPVPPPRRTISQQAAARIKQAQAQRWGMWLGSAAANPAADPSPPADPLEAKLVAVHGRQLTSTEHRLIGTIQRQYDVSYYSSITVSTLREIVPSVRGNQYEPVLRLPGRARDTLEYWQYLALALAQCGATIPEFLRPVTDLEGAQRRLVEAQRRVEIETWQRQFESWACRPVTAAPAAPAAPGATIVADFRLALGRGAAALQWRVGDQPAFTVLKPTRLKQLLEAYQLGQLEVVPAAVPLWIPLYARFERRQVAGLKYDQPESVALLNTWLRQPALAERIVTDRGQPFPRRPAALRWQIEAPADPAGDYALGLVTAEGVPCPPLWLVLAGQPTLYVTEEAIQPGPPPVPAEAMPHRGAVVIPAPALESVAGLRFLTGLGADVPAHLESRIRRVAATVEMVCQYRPLAAGSGASALLVKVVAAAAKTPFREQYTGDGWYEIQRGRPPRKGDDEVIWQVDRSAQTQAAGLVAALGLRWDDRQQKWHRGVGRDFPELFTAWLASVPPAISVRLDGELASLRDGPVTASVRLDCAPAGIDWFDLRVVVDAADTALTPEELAVLLAAGGRYVRLEGKGWRRLQVNLADGDQDRLARLGLGVEDFRAEPQRLHVLQLADDAAARFLPDQQVQEIRRRAAELQTRVTPPVPAAVTAQLRPYQTAGYHFLAYLSANRFGGVLADDMGLGKTLQALAWLAWLRDQPGGGARPSLVVCPKSVMDNWRAEAARFVPSLRVRLWQGTDAAALPSVAADTDLVVANYTQLRSFGPALGGLHWLAVILDEGQYIKNPGSQTATVARAVNAEHRLVLTGTPIENRLLDLWSLMAFAMPGVLGNRQQFARRFSQADDPLARRRLAARVRPFLLRRTKAQVAQDLPDRVEEDLYCELEPAQQTLYRAELKRAQRMLLGIQTTREFDQQRFHFLTSLLRLRQICCHPGLVDPAQATAPSAKAEALFDLLEPVLAEGHKVLVFSQFVALIDLLEPALREREYPLFRLTGATENRGELVAAFQAHQGGAVFLISLKAGGFGLNLTAASYVVLFDPWWNPAVEAQAIDRTHRIGQTRNVTAYRLLTKNSIEEKIRHLQKTKSALAADILGEENFGRALSLDDLRFLFAE